MSQSGSAGEGQFKNPAQVVSFIRCECPGRPLVANMGMSMKLSQIKPEKIYLSSCLVNAKPGCPYTTAEELATMLQSKIEVPVVLGTHDYH